MSHAIDRTGDWKARLYTLGFDLFNRGERFEAHEEWEAIWLDEPKGHPNRLFLQGLIQVAAAFHLIDLGFPKASYRLFRSARRKLIPYTPSYKGVDVAALLPHLERWQRRMAAVVEGSAAPEARHFPIPMVGPGWHDETRAHDASPEDQALFKAFEQYSSDRQVTAACPKCGEVLTVNGRRRAPQADGDSEWRVWCPRACISRHYAGAR